MSTDQPEQSGDMEISPTSLPIFPNPNKPLVKVWQDKFEKGILTYTHFKDHWRIWVAKIYNPEPNCNFLNWNFDDQLSEKILFSPLEEFICNGDPSEILKRLTQMDNPPSICGKVFKMSEPTYSCRECGMDSTCVLCVDCFKQSAHRFHKYKMGTSNGGGCCDCGDPEAWKNEPFCKIHLAGIQSKESNSSSNKLPQDIQDRATVTFEAVLNYCYQLLSFEHAPGLPPDLSYRESQEDPLSLHTTTATDTFCTVLFNDETHTFEQVITTLIRILKCSQKDAIEFVTNIDREGRAVVKCSGFQHCNELKSDIERITSRQNNHPLKVLVVHSHVIAHQIFAMKLLHWLQKFISVSESFRILFSNIAINTKLPDVPIIEGILMRDSKLWKSVRTSWHRLFITGMLMEYESKKSLSIIFTQNYGTIMKDYIRDDHDHSFSIVSLSVQLFTVPTLAHYLISNYDVLVILLNTFISESSRRCNASGKLEFERNTSNTSFKRSQYILYDLRYLLSSKPDVWTDELRRGFLHGLSLLLNLFNSMQGMDSVLRQIGQHMEYEPEWESAFNLHIKLSPVISLALEWCGSDKIVLIKSFRLVLKKLQEQQYNSNSRVMKELFNHSANCIDYDVSAGLVSIHLPLSRFLSGLFVYLEKYDLSFSSSELMTQESNIKFEEIMEPVVRAQAMISQVHAGMWRRNGYSLLNQLYFYHNVKCRNEMLDRDIILLQAGAVLIESNEFLIHLINKFHLIKWAKDTNNNITSSKNNEEDSLKHTINLAEEFLGLLITIIGERYVPGVGQVTPDMRLKKDIIQQLCIQPMSHSELNKTLPDDVHLETGMERVIQDVASFKKQSEQDKEHLLKGVYELKEKYYQEYNVFFYHYTREELSKSEECQRKRKKLLNQLECCEPPVLPKLTESFKLIVNLLQCDVMLNLMKLTLQRAIDLKCKYHSENQIHKILHLIGYALREQETGYYEFFMFTEKSLRYGIFELLEELIKCPRIEAHKDLIYWVLNKYKVIVNDKNLVCKKEDDVTNVEDPAVKWRTEMAAQKRAKIMAQMQAMQKHFIHKNAQLFEEATTSSTKILCASTIDEDDVGTNDTARVALGTGQTSRSCSYEKYTCILCQEDEIVRIDNDNIMVLAAFVQQSTVLCQDRDNGSDESDPLYLHSKLGASPHTSTCGHVMHAKCWQEYFDNVLAKENRRPYRLRQPASFDVEKQEYLCPLCECLNNTVLPLLPPLAMIQETVKVSGEKDVQFGDWIGCLRTAIGTVQERDAKKSTTSEDAHDPSCPSCNQQPSTSEEKEDDFPIQMIHQTYPSPISKIFTTYTETGPTLPDNLTSMIHLFAQAAYTKGLNTDPHEGDSRVSLLVWKSTAYSIHSIEVLLNHMSKPLVGDLTSRMRDCLESLTRLSTILASTSTDKTSWSDKKTFKSHCKSLLKILLENPRDGPSVIDWDPFGMLIPLINTLPSLFNQSTNHPPAIITGGINEFNTFKLLFVSLIVQILLTTDVTHTKEESMEIDDSTIEDETNYTSLRTILNILKLNTSISIVEIWNRMKLYLTSYLRCCTLYFNNATNVVPNEDLTRKNDNQFEAMCNYLGLTLNLNELIDKSMIEIIEIWTRHPNVQLSLQRKPLVLRKHLRVKLIDLPDDYSELINTISLFVCPNTVREDSRNPTLCLVCGQMLCSQSYCCQTEINKIMVGACTYHASQCGTGIGLFLRVKECEILFLRTPNRGCFVPPPYLDEYGEADQGLRRGNPLKLSREKYERLEELWIGHGVHETIARVVESSGNLMANQWQNL